MSQTLTVNLARPVISAKILNNYSDSISTETSDYDAENSVAETEKIQIKNIEAEKTALTQTCQVLNGLNNKLREFYNKIFAEHKEEIAKLSVEIARKILVQKVQDGDYRIESIIEEALKNAPTHQDIVIHLNPDDLEQWRKVQQEEPSTILSGFKIVPDPNVGRAECIVENPKGIIKSLIEQHLETISQSLREAN
jgi:flagellar biosynthesis/type III secretory pathway protein FliH